MSQFTKKAIVHTFIDLLNERSLDKITVTDIVEKCGINRNTFYYYYPDIYALTEELFLSETQRIIEDSQAYETWGDAFLQATQFAGENRQAIYHIYNSVSRARLEQYLRDVTMSSMTAFIRREAEGLAVDEQDVTALSVFYTSAVVGTVLYWLDDGMHQEPQPFIARLTELMDGDIRAILERHAGKVVPVPEN